MDPVNVDAPHLQRTAEERVARVVDRSHGGLCRSPRTNDHAAGTGVIRTVEHDRTRARRIDDRLVVGACLTIVILPDRETVNVIQLIQNLVELCARRGIAQSHGPPVAVVRLITVKQAALVSCADADAVVIGDGRVLLTSVPVALHAVKAAVECIEEAIPCAVVG